MKPVRVKGHAWKDIQTNVYGDKRYLCECGDTGVPMQGEHDARLDHRLHKLQVSTPHPYRKARAPGDRPWGSCGECGQPKDDPVHARPGGVT